MPICVDEEPGVATSALNSILTGDSLMKKNIILPLSVLSVLFLVAADAHAQRNPRATAKLEKGGQFVMVEYGRPSLKGRDMLSQLQPGKTWRMGADKSTTFTCSSNLSFGKVSIPQGSYSIWLRKLDEKNFQLVFNKTTGQWGTEHDVTQDIATVLLDKAQNTESAEQFTINFKENPKGGEMELLWGTLILKAPFQFK
jgi:DUF2911 family protein